MLRLRDNQTIAHGPRLQSRDRRARTVGGDLIENIDLIDHFVHPATGRTSHCFRINYRSHDRTLTGDFVDSLQAALRSRAEADLGVELR